MTGSGRTGSGRTGSGRTGGRTAEPPPGDPGTLTREAAVRRWLALEHEAVWLHGEIGARLESLRDQAKRSFEEHRRTRDRLLVALAEFDTDEESDTAEAPEPVVPRLSYGRPPSSEQAARHAAAGLERRICAACLTLMPVSGDQGRRDAVAGLRGAATAAVAWGAEPEPFPGLD